MLKCGDKNILLEGCVIVSLIVICVYVCVNERYGCFCAERFAFFFCDVMFCFLVCLHKVCYVFCQCLIF